MSFNESFLSKIAKVRQHPLAYLLSVLIASTPVTLGWFAAHVLVPEAYRTEHYLAMIIYSIVVLFCGIFSLLSVYHIGMVIYADKYKALALALCMEIGLAMFNVWWLNILTGGMIAFLSSVTCLFALTKERAEKRVRRTSEATPKSRKRTPKAAPKSRKRVVKTASKKRTPKATPVETVTV